MLAFMSILLFSLAGQASVSKPIVLCNSDGYEAIPIASIQKVDVVLYKSPNPAGEPEYRAEYTGDSIAHVLAPLNLNVPEHLGSAAAMLTGKIVLHFQLAANLESQNRTLNIGNNRAIWDEQCPEIIYFPSRYLDRSWLP